jgi:hypothetical protein
MDLFVFKAVGRSYLANPRKADLSKGRSIFRIGLAGRIAVTLAWRWNDGKADS